MHISHFSTIMECLQQQKKNIHNEYETFKLKF